MKSSFYVQSLALAILGLTLALMVPATATPKLSLSTTIHMQLMPSTVYSTGAAPTSSPMFFIWNFTEDLSGRDIGSTQVRFFLRGIFVDAPVSIMSDSNLTALVSTVSPSCFTSAGQPACLSLLKTVQFERSYDIIGGGTGGLPLVGTLTFRPTASDTYHIVFVLPNLATMLVQEIRGYETWTTTVIV